MHVESYKKQLPDVAQLFAPHTHLPEPSFLVSGTGLLTKSPAMFLTKCMEHRRLRVVAGSFSEHGENRR